MEFDGTAYGSGQEFTFWGQLFTTTNGALTFKSFQISADAEASADNFMAALALNVNFFGVVETAKTEPVAGTFRVTVTWIEYGEQAGWTFDYTGMAPEPGHSETNGTAWLFRDGFKLRYQLWQQDGSDVFEVTKMESITPRVSNIAIPRLDFDFRNDVKGLVRTTFPGLSQTNVVKDSTFETSLLLKYGGIQIEDCAVTQYDLLSSNVCKLVNAVFQIDSESKMKPYMYPDTDPPAFLTSRPVRFAIRTDTSYCLWIYANYLTNPAYSKYRALYNYLDSAGVSLGTDTSASEPTEDGVYIVPAGSSNSPGIPAGTVTIEVTFQAYQDEFASWIPASETRTVRIDNSSCKPVEFHFLEDLGAYSVIYATEPVETIHAQEAEIMERPELAQSDPYAALHTVARVRGGGRRRAGINSWKTFRCQVYGYDDAETIEWFRQFRDSEDVKIRYTTADGITLVRNVIVSAEDATIDKDGEYLLMDFTFRYHTDLR